MALLEVNNIKKTYVQRFGGNKVEALKNVSFSAEEGEFIAIMGESGSGKTTLLNILAALDRPTAGSVILDGNDLTKIREGEMSAFRRDNLGFVFQDFNLLDTFSVKDNILLPLVLRGMKYRDMEEKLMPVAKALGISALLTKFPYEISGGQKQRLALAVNLVADKDIYVFDEATSNIDVESEAIIMRNIKALSKNKSVIVISHRLANVVPADNIYFMENGEVKESGSHPVLMSDKHGYEKLFTAQKQLEEGYAL